MKLPENDKEEFYVNMVERPYRHSKRVYFQSIELFPTCITKYFKPILFNILKEDEEDYGRLKTVLKNFRARITQKLHQHNNLGLKSGLKRA